MDLNVNVKITLEKTPALINSLSTLADLLQALCPKKEPPAAAAPEPVPQVPVAPPVQPPAPATPVPTAAPKQYTLPEIQAACAPLMDAGKTAELAAVIQGFGVASLLELPAASYGALVVQLRSLGAKL